MGVLNVRISRWAYMQISIIFKSLSYRGDLEGAIWVFMGIFQRTFFAFFFKLPAQAKGEKVRTI